MQVQSLEIPALRKLLDANQMTVCLFSQEMLELDEKAEISSEVLYVNFLDWALGQTANQHVLSKVAFGRLLENTTGLVPVSTRKNGRNARVWQGLAFKENIGRLKIRVTTPRS